MRKNLSALIVLMLAVRPTFNVFHSVALFNLGNYPVSLLSSWSLVYLVLGVARLMMPPFVSGRSLMWLKILAVWMLATGAYRSYFPEALIVDIGYALMVLLSIWLSPKIFADLSIKEVCTKIAYGAILLIGVHSTAKLWYSGPTSYTDYVAAGHLALHNYIGPFGSKQLASISLFAVLPFLLVSYLKEKSKGALLLFSTSFFFLAWTLYRTYLLCFTVAALAFFLKARSLRYALLVAALIVIVWIALPRETVNSFFAQKIYPEYDAYISGDIGKIGAGRVGIYIYGFTFFRSQMSSLEKLVGLGAGHNFRLHEHVIGGHAFAHGQWIALLIDYGVIGLVIYLMLLVSLYSDIQKMPDSEKHVRNAIFSLLVAVVVLSSVGHFLQKGGTGALLAFLLGYPIYSRWLQKRRAEARRASRNIGL